MSSQEEERDPTSAASRPANAMVKTRTVLAVRLVLHPMIGLDAATLKERYSSEVEPELDRLRRNQPLLNLIEVVPLDGEKLGATGPIPAVIAAMDRVREDPGCRIQVIERQSVDEVAFLTRMFDPGAKPTLWEQARALERIVQQTGTVRAWIKANELHLATWEPKLSRVRKLDELDEDILAAIDPFSITSVKVVDRLVKAWRDDDKREMMAAILEKAVRGSNERLWAPPLFKEMLAALEPPTSTNSAAPQARQTDSGFEIVGADHSLMATIQLHSASMQDVIKAVQGLSLPEGRKSEKVTSGMQESTLQSTLPLPL